MGLMIDVTGDSLPGLLAALGGNYPDTMAGYVTGIDGIDWPAAAWPDLAPHTGLFHYDQSPQLVAFASGAADGADPVLPDGSHGISRPAIEQGAATLDTAVRQTRPREAKGWFSWWYVELGILPEVRQARDDAGFRRVRLIVADWSLSQAAATVFLEQNADTDAVQWASPTSNPRTLVPGTSKTLAELNCDLNVTRAGWFARKRPPVTDAREGVIITPDLVSARVTSGDGKTWTVT